MKPLAEIAGRREETPSSIRLAFFNSRSIQRSRRPRMASSNTFVRTHARAREELSRALQLQSVPPPLDWSRLVGVNFRSRAQRLSPLRRLSRAPRPLVFKCLALERPGPARLFAKKLKVEIDKKRLFSERQLLYRRTVRR